jgi:hypothetical protein
MADLGAFFGNPNLQRQGAKARELAKRRDVNTLADPLTYAVMQGLLGTRPDEMGFSVLNPDYEKIKKVAEPAFALGLLGQAAPALAPLTKGLPVGATIKNVGKDLSAIQIGDRTIPVTINRIDKKSGGELVNVNPSAFDEAYSKTGWQYVGEKGKDGISGRYEKFENYLKDAKSIEASNVSVNKDGGIVFGDGRHRYAVLRDMGLDELPIVMDKESIKNAKKFGYLSDSPKNPTAPRQEALDTAQRNAALPIEEGGLGLPKDNTPEMREKAMGFIDAYHGTTQGARKEQLRDAEGWSDVWATDNPKVANTYATGRPQFGRPEGQAVMPLSVRLENPMVIDAPYGSSWRQIDTALPNDPEVLPYSTDMLAEIAKKEGYDSLLVKNVFDVGGGRIPRSEKGQDALTGTTYAIFNPAQVRSRFAAFDPMRKNDKDLLAGVLPLGLLADEEQRKRLYELMPSLLGE